MNRLVFGLGVLLSVPVFSGCGTFYLTAPPAPAPTATPLPPVAAYPFDENEGIGTSVGTAIQMNGTPTTPAKFRIAIADDIRTVASRENDPANAYLLLILQRVNVASASAASAPAASTASAPSVPAGATAPVAAPASGYVGSTRDANYLYHLAGIIVPGAGGNVGGGLQDADEQQLLLQASNKMKQTIQTWLVDPPIDAPVAGTTPAPLPTVTPTPTSRPRRGAAVGATPTPLLPSIINPDQLIDVVQDPQFPIDTQRRPQVQVFFTAIRGGGNITKGMKLSLNRMLVRSGLAVVDLYSSTSFDQKTWLLDEAYARDRHLGLWGMQLNGKKLVLQQRVPSPSTGTGGLSNVPITNNIPPKPGAPIGSATPTVSATQSPATLTPTVRPLPATIQRVIPKSDTSIQRGPITKSVLPAPAPGAASAVPAAGATPGSGSGSLPGSGG